MCLHPSFRARQLVAVAALLLSSTAPSARQQATAPQQQLPGFRSGVQVVEVDVRVFASDGRFVADLNLEEFEVLEDGTPQRIQNLHLIGGADAGAGMATGPSSEPAGATVPTRATPERQTWIFVFDVNHLTPGAGFDRGRAAVEEFIAARFRDGDLGGVLAGGRMVNNRLTSVRAELIEGVKSVKPDASARTRQIELTRQWPRLQDEWEAIQIANNDDEALRRAVARACAEDQTSCDRADTEIAEKARRLRAEMDRAALATLNTLNALASGLTKVPGPKTIVFLSDGFIVERSETNLRQVVGQTARAGARVYALDVRGLNRGRNAGMVDQLAVDGPAGAPTQFDALVDGVSSLSVDTGGLLIRNENNLGRALDRIARDAGTYYVLGYQPVNTAFDGRFRSIDVRVKRAGLQVRARRGYVALEPARMLVPQPLKAIGDAASRNTEAPGSPTGAPTPPVAVPSPESLPSLSTPVLGSVVDRGGVPTDAIRLRPGAAERVREIAAGRTGSDGDLSAQGWKAYERGDVETAAALLTRAAAQPDVRPWVLYTLGLSQYALGQPLDAAASWERVRLSAPEFDAVYIDLADAYMQSADLTKALEVLRDGSRRWPSNPEFHNAIGVLHVRRGALDEGIAAFTRAAAAAPDDPLAYFNLGRAYELRYARSHRYVSSQGRWTSSDGDRRKAAESYEQCLRLGGPYVQAATESLRRLEWSR